MCPDQVSGLLNQSARASFQADQVLNIWPIGRFPDDPRPDQCIMLNKLLLHDWRKGTCQPDGLRPNLPDIPAKLGHTRPVVISCNGEVTLIEHDPVQFLPADESVSVF